MTPLFNTYIESFNFDFNKNTKSLAIHVASLPHKYPNEYSFVNDKNFQNMNVIYIGIDDDLIRRTKVDTNKILVYWHNQWNPYKSVNYWNNLNVDIKELAKGLRTQDWINLFGNDALQQIKK